MKIRKNIWKKLLLIPLLCLTVSLLGGCAGGGQKAQAGEQETLRRIEPSDSQDPVQEEIPEISADDPGGGSASESASIDKNGVYTTAEDVALYLHTYGELPHNFITKKEARARGWPGGSLEEYAPGMCIGGDRFGNYEGILPDGNYHECDINTLGKQKRGPERLVYSDDGRIYYTGDHYESFTLLYGE